jgi:hypothetical protein
MAWGRITLTRSHLAHMAKSIDNSRVARSKGDLHNVPRIFGGMAELAARYTGREGPAADGNLLVHKRVSKVVFTLGHGANKDANALLGPDALDVVTEAHQRRLKTKRHLAAVGRQVVSNGVLNDAQQLVVRVRRPDRQAVQQLHHETGESLERSGNSDRRGDLDEDALGGVDVDLELSSLVDGGVKERQEALQRTSQSAC